MRVHHAEPIRPTPRPTGAELSALFGDPPPPPDRGFVVGGHFGNGQSVHGFASFPVVYPTIEAAVEAARHDHRTNVRPGAAVEFTIYRADDGAALVEVTERGDGFFRAVGLYKVAPVEAG